MPGESTEETAEKTAEKTAASGGGPSLGRVLELLAADPPSVHPGAPQGVWAAATDCLEFIAGEVDARARTLETGCGATTVVFAAAGCDHTAVFLDDFEGAAVRDWCATHGIDAGSVTFAAGSSSRILPTLPATDLDLVMVDGCHGFPFPQLDWYYTASRLVDGGLLIVDDTQLAAPYELRRYLEHDPRWDRVRLGSQWAAFRRRGRGSLDEEWTSQRFYPPLPLRVEAAKRTVRSRLGRLKQKAKGAVNAG